MAEAQAPTRGAAHVAPVWIYVLVYGALLALTAATVGAALIDLGRMSVVVAVGIAIAKATLVVLYFMHVRYTDRTTAVVVIAGVFWLIHLCAGTMGDYLSRGFIGVPGK